MGQASIILLTSHAKERQVPAVFCLDLVCIPIVLVAKHSLKLWILRLLVYGIDSLVEDQ